MQRLKALYDESCVAPYGLGLHFDIPDEKYHQIKAISQSYMKYAHESMIHFASMINGAETERTPAMMTGTLLHLAILQPSVFKNKVVVVDVETKAKKEFKSAVEDNPLSTVIDFVTILFSSINFLINEDV